MWRKSLIGLRTNNVRIFNSAARLYVEICAQLREGFDSKNLEVFLLKNFDLKKKYGYDVDSKNFFLYDVDSKNLYDVDLKNKFTFTENR